MTRANSQEKPDVTQQRFETTMSGTGAKAEEKRESSTQSNGAIVANRAKMANRAEDRS